jgi:opacity protein-like surface antigen
VRGSQLEETWDNAAGKGALAVFAVLPGASGERTLSKQLCRVKKSILDAVPTRSIIPLLALLLSVITQTLREFRMSRRKGVYFPALATVIAASAAFPALAGDGLYVGASAGSAIFQDEKSDLDAATKEAFNENNFSILSGSSTLNKASVTYSGVIGYQFFRQIAVEASYTDLGKLRYHADDVLLGGGFSNVHAAMNLDAKVKGPTVAMIGALPFSQEWEIYARLGVIFSKTTLEAQATLTTNAGTATGAPSSQSSNSVDPLAGIGLAWNPTKHFKIRAEYIRYARVGDKDTTGEINIDSFNAGLTYSF